MIKMTVSKRKTYLLVSCNDSINYGDRIHVQFGRGCGMSDRLVIVVPTGETTPDRCSDCVFRSEDSALECICTDSDGLYPCHMPIVEHLFLVYFKDTDNILEEL